MFDGHTLAEAPPFERVPLRSAGVAQPPHIVQTIAPLISPYLWKITLLLGISFTGFALPLFTSVDDVTPAVVIANGVVVFMRAFGVFGVLAYLFALCYEIGYFEREWQLRAEERRAKLPGPKPQEIRLTIDKRTPTGFHQETRTIVNPPSLAFLSWLWWSQGSGGRIPGERAIEAEFRAGADDWLDTLTKEGFLEKTGLQENAPRRIVAGTTFVEMCARFGYQPTPEQITEAIAGVRTPRTAVAPHAEAPKITADVQK